MGLLLSSSATSYGKTEAQKGTCDKLTQHGVGQPKLKPRSPFPTELSTPFQTRTMCQVLQGLLPLSSMSPPV
jgi:hypothetical protein